MEHLRQQGMSHPLLVQTKEYQPALLDIDAKDLHILYPGPTLLHLEGDRPEPLFISVLQHGNEVTGLGVVQKLLQKYRAMPLPRNLSIFFGNTQSARYGKRVLEHQLDYNRAWPGTTHAHGHEITVMQAIFDEMKQRRVFASIDIHNNTGLNPFYACVNSLERQHLELASYFGHTLVYFLTPKGVQSIAFSKVCPAVTIECGKSEFSANIDYVFDYVDTILHLNNFHDHTISHRDFDLFHTVARVIIPETSTFSFSRKNSDILLNDDIEKMNFSEIPADTSFASVGNQNQAGFIVMSEDNQDISQQYFYITNQQIRTLKPVMPAMLTTNEEIIRQDCLCYLMERIQI